MNKKYLILLSLSILFSCTEESRVDEVIQPDSDYPVFYASLESSPTRTYADPERRVLWHEGDRVSIFNMNTTNLEYMFEGQTGDSDGTFRIVEGVQSVAARSRSLSRMYAVYPYDSATQLNEDGTITLDFPAAQSYAENSFGIGCNTMVAVAEDDTLLFKNVGGYLVFKLYGKDISVSSVSLTGNNDEKICGTAQVIVSPDGIPSVVDMSGEDSGKISLACETPVALGTSEDEFKEFWIVLPPVTFTKGFTVNINDNTGRRMVKTTEGKVEIMRNAIYRMAPLDVAALPYTQFVWFEDPAFKAYCVKNFDTSGDGEIDLEEALKIKRINAWRNNYFSFVGIEWFSNLEELNGDKNRLTSLDVSHNPKLTTLNCDDNQLTSLDVSRNPVLRNLNCRQNQLGSLDLSQNQGLWSLDCGNNLLESLDVSSNAKLMSLNCRNNQLTSLDVSQNQELWSLDCGNNRLESLEVTQLSKLNTLYCNDNRLTALEILRHPNWQYINCSNNSITSLDVTGCLMLRELICDYNQLTTIDLHTCPILTVSGDGNPWVEVILKAEWYEADGHLEGDLYSMLYDSDVIQWYYYDEFYEFEEIDMGLSVNWASANLMAGGPEDFGGFYAWGEVAALGDYDEANENLPYINYKFKSDYCQEYYKWGDGSHEIKYTKYCYDSSYGSGGYSDDLLYLEEEDDAASVALGDGWRIPTAEEWLELADNCRFDSEVMNGVKGVRVTSIVPGYTDKSIFLPLAGEINGREYWGDVGYYYWSSSLKSSMFDDGFLTLEYASSARLSDDGGLSPCEPERRFIGLPIRPVRPKD